MVLFIDSFMFNGEELVKLRLEYLYDYVDYFYVVESIYTHSGIKKDMYYHVKYAEWFAPYLLKVKFVQIDQRIARNDTLPYSMQDTYTEENSQRNVIRGILLDNFKEDFILALCDYDELYNISKLESKEVLYAKLNDSILLFRMKMYTYNFNFHISDDWEMAYLISSNMLKTEDDLNKIRVHKQKNCIRLENGWHFTNFSSPETLVRKLESFLHWDLNVPPYNNVDYIKFCMIHGLDIFRRDTTVIKKIEFDDVHNGYPEIFRKYYQKLCSAYM